MKKLSVFPTGFVFMSVFAGCAPKTFIPSTQERLQTNITSPVKRPYWPTKEWQVSGPEKKDMDVTTADLPEEGQAETKIRQVARYAISACKQSWAD